MSRLIDTYWQLFQDEGPLELEDFLKQVQQGRHGDVTPQHIRDFLDDMLQTMLSNIQIKATEAPHYEAMREQAELQTVEQIERLKQQYGQD